MSVENGDVVCLLAVGLCGVRIQYTRSAMLTNCVLLPCQVRNMMIRSSLYCWSMNDVLCAKLK